MASGLKHGEFWSPADEDSDSLEPESANIYPKDVVSTLSKEEDD
jgi:hypothetical protein